ncbi:MAG TPA: tetratricopeptide repeat protein, partial [Terriglobia bacterium]|nr:tetratricopeptide repeat protein [Terriglobia bacterium]
TALFHEGGNEHYQLRLAQALVASGHLDEARTYLTRLWQADPASGPVNLELARLAIRRGDVAQVINYYHNAIDGVWQGDSEQLRRNLRQALCEYLIEHGRRAEAVAELMALSAETPDNPQLRTQVGDLYLKAQDYDSALKEFRRSLRLDRKQEAAWAGAGKAAFEMADYRAARGYLTHALELDPKDADSARMLEMANRILAIDPFDRFVSTRVRRQRVIFAFQHALARMESCAQSRGENLNASTPQTDLQKLYASALKVKPEMREQILRRSPDLIDSAMALVFQAEQVIARQCGPPHGIDQALLLIAQKNGVAE